MDQLTTLGKPIIESSNLVKESANLTEHDVEIVRKLIETISPVDNNNYRVHAHLELTSKFAKEIGSELKLQDPKKYADLNLPELEILGLIHDIGRFFNHRWLRSDLIGEHFLKKLNIRPSLIQNLPNERAYVNIIKGINSQESIDSMFNEMTFTQKIIEMADICGKRKSDGGISTFEESLAYHYSSRNNYQNITKLQPIWPSEKKLNPNLVDVSGKVYEKIYDYFQDLGVNLEETRKRILEKEKSTQNPSLPNNLNIFFL